VPRKRRDGTPARAANKYKLTALSVKNAQADLTWDTEQKGLALSVQASGRKAWKCVYRYHGRPRWYRIGDAAAITLADARKLAGRVMFQVAEGKDPQAERRAERYSWSYGASFETDS
jgi:Arm DNA-binding domain